MSIRSKIFAVVSAVGTIALVSLGTPASTANAHGSYDRAQCIFNDDCAPGLICRSMKCRVECRTDRDCDAGRVCDRSPNRYRCVAVPVPVLDGFITGRVEDPPGVPVTRCTLQLDGPESRVSRTCTITNRGEFVFDHVRPGYHELTLVGSPLAGRPSRTIGVWVSPGAYATVGPLIVPPVGPSPLAAPLVVPPSAFIPAAKMLAAPVPDASPTPKK